jgi:hypothetical protein
MLAFSSEGEDRSQCTNRNRIATAGLNRIEQNDAAGCNAEVWFNLPAVEGF